MNRAGSLFLSFDPGSEPFQFLAAIIPYRPVPRLNSIYATRLRLSDSAIAEIWCYALGSHSVADLALSYDHLDVLLMRNTEHSSAGGPMVRSPIDDGIQPRSAPPYLAITSQPRVKRQCLLAQSQPFQSAYMQTSKTVR